MTYSKTSSAAQFDSVSKWYGPVIGVVDVSLRVSGGITGLVGPNGAGKSTLMKLLCGQIRPSLGRVDVEGSPAHASRARGNLGYCPPGEAVMEEMSGRRFVRTMASLRGMGWRESRRRTEEVLEQVGMDERADRPTSTYSKGMRQRIKLAQAMVHDPRLLVLDEPLDGIDPVGRRELGQLFLDLARAGKTLLISSHVLHELDKLADEVVFLGRGRVVAAGRLDEIRQTLDNYPTRVRITTDTPRVLAARLLDLDCVQSIQITDDADLTLAVRPATEFFPRFTELVADTDVPIDCLTVLDASSEAVFEYLIHRG